MSSSLPVIDLGGAAAPPTQAVVEQVAAAAEEFGFFQVVNHGIGAQQIEELWRATRAFFAQSTSEKRQIERTIANSRGYYDKELTKNARDLKEVLDIAHVPFPELGSDDPRNFHNVDGQNQWPALSGFREPVLDYLGACNNLSLWLLQAFCRGLGEHADHLRDEFGVDHTSFLRMNHYPLTDLLSESEARRSLRWATWRCIITVIPERSRCCSKTMSAACRSHMATSGSTWSRSQMRWSSTPAT